MRQLITLTIAVLALGIMSIMAEEPNSQIIFHDARQKPKPETLEAVPYLRIEEKTAHGWKFHDWDSGLVYEWTRDFMEPLVSVEATPLGAAEGWRYRITVENQFFAKSPVAHVSFWNNDWHDNALGKYQNEITPSGWEAKNEHTWEGQLAPGKVVSFEVEANLPPEKMMVRVSGTGMQALNDRRVAALQSGVPSYLLNYARKFVRDIQKFQVLDVLEK